MPCFFVIDTAKVLKDRLRRHSLEISCGASHMNNSIKDVLLNIVFLTPIISYLISYKAHTLVALLCIKAGILFTAYIIHLIYTGEIKTKFGFPLEFYAILQLGLIDKMILSIK